MDIDSLAKAAYGAWRARSKPSWDNLADVAKEQWRNVARAVLEESFKEIVELLESYHEEKQKHRNQCLWFTMAGKSCEECAYNPCSTVTTLNRIEATLQAAKGVKS